MKIGDTVKWSWSDKQLFLGKILSINFDPGTNEMLYFIRWDNHDHLQWHTEKEVEMYEYPDNIFKDIIKGSNAT